MKVLLIDDHRLFSQSLKMILELSEDVDSVDLIETFPSVTDVDFEDYDIILVDINLTSLYKDDGLALSEKIIQENPLVKLVMLTGYVKPIYQYRAQKMGAVGFLDKSLAPNELLVCLQDIQKGKRLFSQQVPMELLTPREIEVLTLVREGLNMEAICKQLFLGKRTVSNHLASCFAKLEVTNRQEAIYQAELLGYFSPK